MTLLSALTHYRAATGLSYGALAKRSELEVSHVFRIFKGEHRPRPNTLIRLALALGLTVQQTDELLRLGGFEGLILEPPDERDEIEREKSRAHSKVSVAIKDKTLTKEPCEVCGSTKYVIAHHDDYSRPLEVHWLCRKHHSLRHQEMKTTQGK